MKLFVAGCSLSWTERANSCYVIDDHILFDCGEGTSKNIVKKYGESKLADIDWIFITHFHADHIFSLCQYLSQSIIFKHREGKEKLTIVGPKGLLDVLDTLFTFSTKKQYKIDEHIHIKEVDCKSAPIKVDNYTISMYNLHHGDIDDIGYVIDDGKQRLGYTGDTVYDQNLLEMVNNCDAVICDVSGEKNTANHMGVEGYNSLKTMFPNKKFYAVHCSGVVYNDAKKHKLILLHENRTYNFEKGKLVLKR